MSKSEKKAGPGEGKNGKKKWIIVGVVAVLVLAAAPEGANLNTPKRILHFFEKVVAVVLKFSK